MPLYELLKRPAPRQAITSDTEYCWSLWNAHDTFVFQSSSKMVLISGLIKIYLVISEILLGDLQSMTSWRNSPGENLKIHFSFWTNFKTAVPDSSKFYSLNKKSRIAIYQLPYNNLNRFIQEK